MATQSDYSKAVMDFIPWVKGLGFSGTDEWWAYVRSRNEKEQLDLLMAMALLSEEVHRLLLKHDQDLLHRFAFSEQTMTLLLEIEAKTLDEFARVFWLKLASSR